MVGDAFKAYRREIVCVFVPVVMVRGSSRFGVAWVFVRGRAINIMCRRIRVTRSIIWRRITWLVHFKPYRLSSRLKTHIGTRRWRITRHLVCCLFTFAAGSTRNCSCSTGDFRHCSEKHRQPEWYRQRPWAEALWARSGGTGYHVSVDARGLFLEAPGNYRAH